MDELGDGSWNELCSLSCCVRGQQTSQYAHQRQQQPPPFYGHYTGQHTLATAPPVKNWRGFCWCKVLLPSCPCWWQPVHSDQGGDAGVLLNSVIYTVSVPYAHQLQIIFLHFRSKESCIRWAAHCGATWQIQLYEPCEAAMQPYFDHVLIIHWTGFLL